jgi:hypothetical protein
MARESDGWCWRIGDPHMTQHRAGARGKSRGTVLYSDETGTSGSSTSKCPMRSQAFLPSFGPNQKAQSTWARHANHSCAVAGRRRDNLSKSMDHGSAGCLVQFQRKRTPSSQSGPRLDSKFFHSLSITSNIYIYAWSIKYR